MKKNRDIIIASIFIVGLVAGLIIFAVFTTGDNNDQAETASLTVPILESDRSKGNADAKVQLVEYGDFQCPACGLYYPVLLELLEEFGDQVLFVYRHFPLTQHANAHAASRAAEASGKQDKFWEMHNALFENQEAWAGSPDPSELFRQYAASLELNMEEFSKDMDAAETYEKVESDFQSGISSGLGATPTFFLNGKKINNPRGYEEFRRVILQALEAES